MDFIQKELNLLVPSPPSSTHNNSDASNQVLCENQHYLLQSPRTDATSKNTEFNTAKMTSTTVTSCGGDDILLHSSPTVLRSLLTQLISTASPDKKFWLGKRPKTAHGGYRLREAMFSGLDNMSALLVIRRKRK